jgi:hypothetical protein
MPFKSKSQRRACYAAHDPNWDCGEWEAHTKDKKLPEKTKKQENFSFRGWLDDYSNNSSIQQR